MPKSGEAVVAEALQLSKEDRDRQIGVLLDILGPEPDDMPESIARPWAIEIARLIEEIDAGRVESIPCEQVMANMQPLIESARKR